MSAMLLVWITLASDILLCNIDVGWFSCHMCGTMFKTNGNLQRHYAQVHAINATWLSCTILDMAMGNGHADSDLDMTTDTGPPLRHADNDLDMGISRNHPEGTQTVI